MTRLRLRPGFRRRSCGTTLQHSAAKPNCQGSSTHGTGHPSRLHPCHFRAFLKAREQKPRFRNILVTPTATGEVTMKKMSFLVLALLLTSFSALNCQGTRKDLEKPERIVSLRQVTYDSSTYARLAQLWKEYYDAYPSEDAYGNWMYAARYAELPEYRSLLEKGVEKYPASSTLLYLLGNEKHMGKEKNNLEALQLFEKSAALDPGYMNPWFGLAVDYQSQGEREKADAALRHLLE